MAKAIALVRAHSASSRTIEIARTAIVAGCALALMLAGRALPF